MVTFLSLRLVLYHFLYDEHSSPKEALFAYLVPLSHHVSMTFYDILWSMHIVEHYKYCVALYY